MPYVKLKPEERKRGGRIPGTKPGSGEELAAKKLRRVLHKCSLEVGKKINNIQGMELDELAKLIKICTETLRGIERMKNKPGEAGKEEGVIRFETHLASRKVN